MKMLWDEVGGWWSVAFLGVGFLAGGAVVAVSGRLRRRRLTGADAALSGRPDTVVGHGRPTTRR